MLSETKWHGAVAMKSGLDAHASDLISSGQLIELDGGVYSQANGVLCAYHPQKGEFVFRSSDCGSFDVYLVDIVSITVLPVTEIALDFSRQQMRESDEMMQAHQ